MSERAAAAVERAVRGDDPQDFFGALARGEAPKFVQCECGEMTTSKPCYSCSQKPEEAAAARVRMAASGIPARYRWAVDCSGSLVASRVSLAAVDGKVPTLRGARDAIVGHGGPVVLFVGPSGSGKTSFAVACMRAVRRPFFCSAADLDRARIEHSAGHGEAPIVARAMRAGVLVLDDLGQDKISGVSAVEAVILARHNAELPTWITTGLGGTVEGVQAAIDARYNAGIARRLTEDGLALMVGFGGGR